MRTKTVTIQARRYTLALNCVVVALGLTLASCSAVTAGSYLSSPTGLAAYTSIGWGATEGVEEGVQTGDPRLDSNPFFYDRVRADLRQGLISRGYAFATSGTPDLHVHIHVNMTQEIDTSLIDQEFCAEGDCRPFIYDSGTLVVDLVDPVSNRLVWRGWAESSLGELVNDQSAMERRIDDSVEQILARLPARF